MTMMTRRLGVVVLALVAAWLPGLCGSGAACMAQETASPADASTEATTSDSAARRAAMEAQRKADAAAEMERRKASAAADRIVDEKITKAIQQLVLEAKDLDVLTKPTNPAVFSRPHPTLRGLGPEASLEALNRMLTGFTNNEYRDTYIRWHLAEVVKKAAQSDREETGKRLVKLVKQMPGPLAVKEVTDHRYEPKEVAEQYFKVYYGYAVTVGYPPFEQRVYPPASLAHLSGERKAQGEAAWEQAKNLKFQTIIDQEARAFNERVRQVNYIVRQYRGEVIYELLKTGDPAMLDLVVNEIDRQARAKSGLAYDLMAFMYLAGFDGVLNLYSEQDLQSASATLEKTARATDAWVEYASETRNFADAAFHMIYMLRDIGGFMDPKVAPTVPNQRVLQRIRN
jgi:hypothetical protein